MRFLFVLPAYRKGQNRCEQEKVRFARVHTLHHFAEAYSSLIVVDSIQFFEAHEYHRQGSARGRGYFNRRHMFSLPLMSKYGNAKGVAV